MLKFNEHKVMNEIIIDRKLFVDSAIGIGNNLYGLLGEVGVYALVDYWFIAIGDAGYIVVIP